MNIGLINNAIIDWFLPWPEQALYAVSTTLLSEDVSLLRIAGKWHRIIFVLIYNILFINILTYIYIV
jgi:hypothetical protein